MKSQGPWGREHVYSLTRRNKYSKIWNAFWQKHLVCLRKHTSREYKPQPHDFASLCSLADDMRMLHWREDKRNTEQGWIVPGSGSRFPWHPRGSGVLSLATPGASQTSDGQKTPGECFRQGLSFWKLSDNRERASVDLGGRHCRLS